MCYSISNCDSSSIEPIYPIVLSSDKGKEEAVSDEVLENQTTIPHLNEDVIRMIFQFATNSGKNGEIVSKMRLTCRAWHDAIDDYVLKPCWIAMIQNRIKNPTLRDLVAFVDVNACSIDTDILIKLFIESVINSALISSSDEADVLDRLSNRIEPLRSNYFHRFSHLTHELRIRGAPIPSKSAVLGFERSTYEKMQQTLDSAVETIWPHIRLWMSLQEINLQGESHAANAQAIRRLLDNPANAQKIARVTELHLSRRNITALFPEIGKFTQLSILKLSSNKLTSLPKTICNLSLLTALELDDNKLKSLSSKIGSLFQLKKLHLSKNELRILPATIGNLAQLTSLDVSSNSLAQLPETIGNLAQLTSLDVSSNSLAQLPETIGNLAQLTSLNVSFNAWLEQLPATLGNLSRLTSIDLSHNSLTSLPKEIGNLFRLKDFNPLANPLIFVLDKNFDRLYFVGFNEKVDHQKMIKLQSACSTYQCASPLASLCQGILLGSDDAILREEFKNLPNEMQKLIYQKWSDDFSSCYSSCEAGEELLFDDRKLFIETVINSLPMKWNALSEKQRQEIYAQVAILAGHPEADARKREALAEENIIRFIDAMESVIN